MRLLVVEDDKDINRQVVAALEEAGYVADKAYDGEEGGYLGESEPYDAIILDMGLPKADGVTVLQKWRRAGVKTPVIILTARDRWSDKVDGFDAGADDYVTKPFHMEELMARVRALLRRAAGHASSQIACGPVTLDTRSGKVFVDGAQVKLTSHEYRLLSYLMHHTGRVVSRAELTEHLYDQDFDRDFEHHRGVRRAAAQEARRGPDPDGARPRLPGGPQPAAGAGVTALPAPGLLPAVFMRGGTSKALMLHRRDVPGDLAAWEPAFLSAMDSPDPFGRQLNGMGGGVSSVSKICVVERLAPARRRYRLHLRAGGGPRRPHRPARAIAATCSRRSGHSRWTRGSSMSPTARCACGSTTPTRAS